MTIGYPVASILLGALGAGLVAWLAAFLVARAGFPLPPSRGRIGCLDGLRGLLALAVLVHHGIVWLQVERLGGAWAPPALNLFNQLGAGAVGLFFMTTGLLFYPRVRAGVRACSWPALLTGRFFRIVPLVAVSVGLVTALIAVRTGRGLDAGYPAAAFRWISAWDEPPLLGYPDSGRLNAYVLWSLRYEWIFYLLVLPACALARDLTRGRLPAWTIPAALLVGALCVGASQVRTRPMPQILPLFALGMLTWEVQARERVARWLRTPAAAVLAVAALAAGMVAAPSPYGPALPLFAGFFACVACGNTLGGLLRTRAALVLGECSFGIYLLHGLVLSVLFTDLRGVTAAIPTDVLPLVLLPAAALVVALVTPLTYLAVERPAIRLGARLVRRRSAARGPAPATA
ncbi:acyltransferase [Methylobacterium sp. NEAU 140]|uniref:acyltransferase family protein n=1 Tax=Methylobacterium sp. NEAU 140 TaxID=3064945 RepID=UPI002735C702|nr:acyltransferase [Methylobacterium sp. NEAU 140]MDP4026937.1 acyltransferase [Methylobacterium sp. NEAU 140]